ncbi:hypothetical protein Bca4012_011767 [Brassica carinata]|uniref:Uncharacterized protein n=1 Tax=Brassica carinata TaxID=52824 RepID=A0A8X7S5A1_BRACI|nr:hypothetical protein Bca52824_036644 [Brassica carinata]
MEAAIKTLENQLKQKKENLKKLQDEVNSLESVIQSLKPKKLSNNRRSQASPRRIKQKKKKKSIENLFRDRLLFGGGGSMQLTINDTHRKNPNYRDDYWKKEVQNKIKPTIEKFLENFDEINIYPEKTKYKHIYPKNHQGLGPKTIVLPEASPITTINLHSFGFIETLYIQNPEQQLKIFSQGLKTAVSRYFTRYAKNKEVFMQYYRNYPEFQITET